jgi:hypothetical protein
LYIAHIVVFGIEIDDFQRHDMTSQHVSTTIDCSKCSLADDLEFLERNQPVLLTGTKRDLPRRCGRAKYL